MHKITIIAAVASDEAIGRDGKLIFNIRDDLRRFKRLTMGHTMIMGRHTFESLPGILPGRRHIVVSRRKGYAPKGAEVAPSLERAISMCGGEDEIMIMAADRSMLPPFRWPHTWSSPVWMPRLPAPIPIFRTWIRPGGASPLPTAHT